MLHDYDRIAFVAQAAQRSYELAVVFLMEADARLIEYIYDIDEFGAYLGSQSDSLALSSREARRTAVQAQILETHVEQETDAVGKFAQDVGSDGLAAGIEPILKRTYPGVKLGNLHCTDLGDGFAVHAKTPGCLIEPGTVTYRAYNPVFYVLDHSVPGEHLRERAFTHPEKIIGTVNQQRNYAVAQILNRFIQAEAQLSGDCAEDFELFGGAYAAERCYASVGYRKLAVGDDAVHIHIHNRTKSLAMRAIAFGRIEREGVRGRLGK